MKHTQAFGVLVVILTFGVAQASAQQMGYPPPGAYPQPAYAAWQPPYGQQFAGPGYSPAAYPQQAPVAPGACGVGPSCESCAGNGCGISGWQFFGDFLYLRARGAEVPYAVPISGPIVAPPSYPTQVGRVASVDPEYQPGFRVGFARALDESSSLRGTYTFYESETSDRVTLPGASSYVLRSLVSHPGTWTASSDGLDGQAHLDIDFQIADADYRSIFACGPRYELAYLAGVKYVHLEQEFRSQFDVLGTELVNTRINFDGGGIRVGLEGERRASNCGLLVYGRTTANFVAGEFRADYLQADGSRGTVVDTGMTTSRVMSILDLELGVGWVSPDGCLRLTGGYMVSGWFNTLQIDEWIRGVHNNSFSDLSDTLTFDGFTARAEIRF